MLSKDGKVKNESIHRLVAQAFIPNPDSKPQVNHIDCNTLNNNVSNLEWCTAKENTVHAWKNGMCKHSPKSNENLFYNHPNDIKWFNYCNYEEKTKDKSEE